MFLISLCQLFNYLDKNNILIIVFPILLFLVYWKVYWCPNQKQTKAA